MNRLLTQFLIVFVMPLVLVLGMVADPAIAFTADQQYVAEVWRIVNRAYLDDQFNGQNWWFVRQEALREAPQNREEAYDIVQSMLAGLDDPYTRLLRPSQYRTLQTNTSGELTGVGLQIALDEAGQLRVVSPIAGSPAAAADIHPRDVVAAIDGNDTTVLSLDEAASLMRGPVGTTVTLTVQRGEAAPFDLAIQRDRIVLNPLYTDLRTTDAGLKVGYLRLTQFSANATSELYTAIIDFELDEVDGYILDLRNNPGGLLQAGIEIARLWLDDGAIVYTVNRQGVADSFEAFGSALTAAPLVVLVNSGTASASEILAGALQDNQRATLVGETTFGKGLIQSLFNLPDGSGVAVTVAKYETPAHHDINKLGITPDRSVPLTQPLSRLDLGTAADPQYQAAIAALQSM